MTYLIENLWVWVALAFLSGTVGYLAFLNDKKNRTLGIGIGAAVALLLVGLILFFFVDTDRKSITRMLDGLAGEIEKDNIEGVLEYISPKATRTRGIARGCMLYFLVPSARYQNLKIEVNSLTHPPVAQLTFTGVVQWKTKGAHSQFDFMTVDTPLHERVEVSVELEKTNTGSWRVTDKCRIQNDRFNADIYMRP